MKCKGEIDANKASHYRSARSGQDLDRRCRSAFKKATEQYHQFAFYSPSCSGHARRALWDWRHHRVGDCHPYPALREAQFNFYSIASPEAFHTSPERAWGFYGHRLALYRETVPHRGYNLLRHWGARMLHGSRVFTSNVDGQVQKAGFDQVTLRPKPVRSFQLICVQS